MKFTLRDLFWLTIVVAMGLGWWMDHRQVESLWIEANRELRELKLSATLEKAQNPD